MKDDKSRLLVKCSVCGKIGRGRLPKNGDGTFYFPRRHDVDGKPCDGNYHEAKWVTLNGRDMDDLRNPVK